MSQFDFRFERGSDGIAVLTFDRPETLNSLTFDIYGQLERLFHDLDDDETVKAVVITGHGRGFCSGGSVEDIIGPLLESELDGTLAFTRMTGAVVRNMLKLQKPIVAAINGIAAGAGAVLALASDLRVMSEQAKFAFLFTKVGLSGGDMGAAYLLPRVVGLGRASELLFLGDVIGAEHADKIGLVTKVTTPEACLPEARALAERLASGPLFAHTMTKQMLESEHTMTLDQAIEAEAQAQAICMQHPDFRAAYEGWANKRPIVFQGASGPFDSGAERRAKS